MRRDATWRSTRMGGAPVFFRLTASRPLLDVSLFCLGSAPTDVHQSL